ncbi:uncharacterized protein N7518_001899 [Penicillium psychrosexuale]|uniref:uncharacterized protein n=1 Tax=Penicillium psychrosexuale TaxID=1002107 RepID=UPI0025452091|nr:uncharacterized protein N7518_001899 [Penicillium psychrosexuale]KAJ5799831.1 hypothetical protein N7518_001899 [Penicillium psychrosexuale]
MSPMQKVPLKPNIPTPTPTPTPAAQRLGKCKDRPGSLDMDQVCRVSLMKTGQFLKISIETGVPN